MVISSVDKQILYVSDVYNGKEHDYTLLKTEFPPEQDWFANHIMRLDSGYQGFQTDYKCQKVYLPHKKKAGKALTDEQKAENTMGAKERIKVEHSIGGLKRYRILSDRSRIRDWQLFDNIIGVCAGLWNYTQIIPN